ncbi:hypothetical protein TRVL_07582 [Trypanosoma vivax]|nr:hypothetical protein TRVL_07582 [Trypanosoma vivax]
MLYTGRLQQSSSLCFAFAFMHFRARRMHPLPFALVAGSRRPLLNCSPSAQPRTVPGRNNADIHILLPASTPQLALPPNLSTTVGQSQRPSCFSKHRSRAPDGGPNPLPVPYLPPDLSRDCFSDGPRQSCSVRRP